MTKRTLSLAIVAVLLLCGAVWARMTAVVVGQSVSAPASSCPDGTYMLAYDSQYAGDVRKACKSDAVTTVTGSDVGTISVDSTNGVTINAVDEGLLFSSLSSAEIPAATGTAWMSVYCSASRSTSVHVLSLYYDTSNRIDMNVSTAGRMNFYYRGGGNNDSVTSPATPQTCADATWCRAQISWDSSLGDGSEKMKAGWSGKTATETTTMTLDAPTQPTNALVGEPSGIAATTGTVDACQVKNVFILSGYDTADPCADSNADGVCD